MKRRLLSVFMVVVLLLPLSFSAAASTPVVITSEDVRGRVGDTVTATLNIEVEPPRLGSTMDSLQFVLEYDSSALEFVDIQEVSRDRINVLGAQYLCSVTSKTGAVAFAAAASNGGTGRGVLMHVRFRILSAVSTMLVLKKVAYSFVTSNGKTQDRRQGGTVNLGRITGQSAPNTIAPASPAPTGSYVPANISTDEPRFPVTETTPMPGTSPTAEPEQSDSDVLAYIVFGLFIVVAILVCVILTLMIVRRTQNKARVKYFEDDEEEEFFEDEGENEQYDERVPPEEDEEDDEPPIQIVRRTKK